MLMLQEFGERLVRSTRGAFAALHNHATSLCSRRAPPSGGLSGDHRIDHPARVDWERARCGKRPFWWSRDASGDCL